MRRLFGRPQRAATPSATPRRSAPTQRPRSVAFESMEQRQLLATVPLVVGAVYHEMDSGADLHGDTIAIQFEGGMPGTQLTRLVINGDQNVSGLSVGDMIFDTVHGGLGADEAAALTIVSKDGIDSVTWHVDDGSSQLILEFTGFDPGEQLVISIDVDEIQQFDPAETNIARRNEGIDPIASGVEFQGSKLQATFGSRDYLDANGTAEFRNAYDDLFIGTNLLRSDTNPRGLPRDNDDNLRDRSTGGALPLNQTPRPASLCGVVYDDADNDGARDATESGIGGVAVRLSPLDSIAPQSAVSLVTSADGTFCATGLMPGTYHLVETQPVAFLDGIDAPGTVGGQVRGAALNPGDEINQIELHGGDAAVNYTFGEHRPSQIAGFVYHDRNRNGWRESGEEGIAAVAIQLRDGAGQVVTQQVTASDGSYHFDRLTAGVYELVETQPPAWQDGLDTVGTIGSVPVGTTHTPGDSIDQVFLGWGQSGVDYNFGEWKLASLSGRVLANTNEVCGVTPDSVALANVTLELVDANGQLVRTTQTGVDGSYHFDGVIPGRYTVRQVQPSDYFSQGQQVGSAGGNALTDNVIARIDLGSDQSAADYNFCETPPASLSGRVFRDGPALITSDGKLPPNWRELHDGQFTPDDEPLAGVWIELRDGVTGEPLSDDDVLPGFRLADLRVRSDGDGYFEFRGLRGGRSYALFEIQPTGLVDGLDTAGSTGGVVFNLGDPVDPDVDAALTRDPHHDAIVRIPLQAGQASINNWFSELEVLRKPKPLEPPTEPPATPTPIFPPTPLEPSVYLPPFEPVPAVPEAQYNPAPNLVVSLPTVMDGFTSSVLPMTWHLSVVDAGQPRGEGAFRSLDSMAWRTASLLGRWKWNTHRLREGQWTVSVELPDPQMDSESEHPYRQFLFGMSDAIPIAGDFNGDGQTEFGVYCRGEWFIDINSNGQWDGQDLWAQLGTSVDQPVVGDWDGDGKDDIGVFGPEWPGDARALAYESGLPDLNNHLAIRPKNLPPQPDEATSGERLLKLTEEGQARADVIDHVFRFGVDGDLPVAGDWDGDGISTIGVFREGVWTLDTDGDGELTANDRVVRFGAPGDRPVVGDFNGDGTDEIGVYRAGRWIIDSNRNGQINAEDQQFELGGNGDLPVVGDFNGDGIDEPGLYGKNTPAIPRQAALPGDIPTE